MQVLTSQLFRLLKYVDWTECAKPNVFTVKIIGLHDIQPTLRATQPNL